MKNISFLLVALIFFSTVVKAQAPITRIFIVRHADRDGALDDLTAGGLIRANELKRVLALSRIDSIFSTNFIRTKKTVQPLATLNGLPITIYSDIPQLIRRITNLSAKKRVLVVGHSDTVDDLIRQCGCKPPAAIDPQMPTTQYDNLFLVLVQKIPGELLLKCDLIHMKYGAVTN